MDGLEFGADWDRLLLLFRKRFDERMSELREAS